MVDQNGICKVADFGSSKYLDEIKANLTTPAGTPNWMAPEMMNQEKYDSKADIWGLGCLLIEMATGKPPWGEFQNSFQALYTIAMRKSAPPFPSEISEDLRDFLEKCLKYEPGERLSADELREHGFLRRRNWRKKLQGVGKREKTKYKIAKMGNNERILNFNEIQMQSEKEESKGMQFKSSLFNYPTFMHDGDG